MFKAKEEHVKGVKSLESLEIEYEWIFSVGTFNI